MANDEGHGGEMYSTKRIIIVFFIFLFLVGFPNSPNIKTKSFTAYTIAVAATSIFIGVAFALYVRTFSKYIGNDEEDIETGNSEAEESSNPPSYETCCKNSPATLPTYEEATSKVGHVKEVQDETKQVTVPTNP